MHQNNPQFLIVLIGITIAFNSMAQTRAEWIFYAAGADYQRIHAVATSPDGKIAVAGVFSTFLRVGDTKLVGTDTRDAFVATFDATGKSLWSRRMGGSSEDSAYAVAFDKKGSIHVAGAVSKTAKFVNERSSGFGLRDGFLATLDATGEVLRVKRMGGPEEDIAFGVVADDEGNVYVTGFTEGRAQFEGQITPGAAGDDMFLAKYSPEGKLVWVRKLGGLGTDQGRSIAIDKGGYIYVTGWFQGIVFFENTRLTSLGGTDVFIAKYDRDGKLFWAQSAGGKGDDRGYGITVDQTDAIYVTGSVSGAAAFGKQGRMVSYGGRDMFLAKLDSQGALLWAVHGGSKLDDEGLSIAPSPEGGAIVTGICKARASFGQFERSVLNNSTADKNIFVADYRPDARTRWLHTLGGTGVDAAHGVATTVDGKIYVGGAMSGTLPVLAGEGDDSSINPAFLAKITPPEK